MKSLIIMLTFLSQSAFAVGHFVCTGGPYDPVEIAVRSEYQLIINGFEPGEIDWQYARSHPYSKTYRLIGNFNSLGGGTVSVSKGAFGTSRNVRLYRVRRGGDGTIVNDTYRCQR